MRTSVNFIVVLLLIAGTFASIILSADKHQIVPTYGLVLAGICIVCAWAITIKELRND